MAARAVAVSVSVSVSQPRGGAGDGPGPPRRPALLTYRRESCRAPAPQQAEEDTEPRCEYCGSLLRPFPLPKDVPFPEDGPFSKDQEYVSWGKDDQEFALEQLHSWLHSPTLQRFCCKRYRDLYEFIVKERLKDACGIPRAGSTHEQHGPEANQLQPKEQESQRQQERHLPRSSALPSELNATEGSHQAGTASYGLSQEPTSPKGGTLVPAEPTLPKGETMMPAESKAKPKEEAEPKEESEPKKEPEEEAKPKEESRPSPGPKLGLEPDSEPEPEKGPKPEPDEPGPEPYSEPESEKEPKPEPKEEPGTGPEQKPKSKEEPGPGPEQKPKSKEEPGPGPEQKPEPKEEPVPGPEQKPEPREEPGPEPEPKPKAEPGPELGPKPENEPKEEPGPEHRPEPEEPMSCCVTSCGFRPLGKKMRKSKLVQKYYKHGRKFLTMLPDGTSQLFYPSGNLAIIITREGDQLICIVQEDEPRTTKIRALFQSDGRSTCYYPSGDEWINMNIQGGQYLDQAGSRVRRWMWPNMSPGLHVPLSPIFISLNRHVGVRILAQDKIIVSFLAMGRQAKFNMGTKVQVGAARQLPAPAQLGKDELLLLALRVRILQLFHRMRGCIDFPSSEQWNKMQPPAYLLTQAAKILELCTAADISDELHSSIRAIVNTQQL